MLILHEGELLHTDSSATKLYDNHKEKHSKNTARRKKDKTYTEKYSGK